MSKDNELIRGAIYRVFVCYVGTGDRSGDYRDLICDDPTTGTATIVKCLPVTITNYVGGDWFIGGKSNIIKHKAELVAMSLADYNNEGVIIKEIEVIKEVPVEVVKTVEKIKEVEVIKEVIVEKTIRVDRYEDTWIDRMYNSYCESLGRFDEFV